MRINIDIPVNLVSGDRQGSIAVDVGFLSFGRKSRRLCGFFMGMAVAWLLQVYQGGFSTSSLLLVTREPPYSPKYSPFHLFKTGLTASSHDMALFITFRRDTPKLLVILSYVNT